MTLTPPPVMNAFYEAFCAASAEDEPRPGNTSKLHWKFTIRGEIVAEGDPCSVTAGCQAPDDIDGQKVRHFEILTLGELRKRQFPEPNWIVPGIMSEGLNILGGAPKQGKAQPLDALVLTPTGYKRMGDLIVGDHVVAADGLPATVLQIHEQGVKPVFRVQVSDGSSVEATEDHWWTVFTHTDRVRNRPGRLRTTGQIAAILAEGKTRENYLPIASPVQFDNPLPLPLDPYLLGVILGDGCTVTSSPSISFGDRAIVDCIEPTLPRGIRVALTKGGTCGYLTKPTRSYPRENAVTEALKILGVMGKRSYEKTIPLTYMTASTQDRFSLLQGLLDTDGTLTLVRCGTGQIFFSSTSPEMSEQVVALVESLGGTARLRWRQTYAHSKTGKKAGRPSSVILIRLPADLGCPFRLLTKAEKWKKSRTGKDTPPVRRITAIEPVGEKPCRCITIDRHDGLYLTEHCIVTHNSLLALYLALTVAGGGMALGAIKVESQDVLYLSLEDKHRRVKFRAEKMMEKIDPSLAALIDERLSIVTDWPRQDDGGLSLIRLWTQRVKRPGLVIIDVWNRFCPLQRGSNSAYSRDAEDMSEVKKFTDQMELSTTVIHHTRKPGLKEPDDFVNEISGTLGLAGSADGIMVLNRNRNDNQARLHITGRDVTEQELVLEFDVNSLTWKSLGTAEQHVGGRVQEKIIAYLKSLGAAAFTKDIAEAIDEDQDSVRVACNRLRQAKMIRKQGNAWQWPADEMDNPFS